MAVSVHPGLIDTHLSRNWIQEGDVLGRVMRPLVNLFMRPLLSWILLPVSFGVRSVLFAAGASAEEVRTRSGRAGQSYGQTLCCYGGTPVQ